jgi:hypothetical protein
LPQLQHFWALVLRQSLLELVQPLLLVLPPLLVLPLLLVALPLRAQQLLPLELEPLELVLLEQPEQRELQEQQELALQELVLWEQVLAPLGQEPPERDLELAQEPQERVLEPALLVERPLEPWVALLLLPQPRLEVDLLVPVVRLRPLPLQLRWRPLPGEWLHSRVVLHPSQ